MNAYSKNLSALIDALDITQQQLAESIGVSATSVNGWIKRGVNPSASNIETICKLYNLKPDDIMSEDHGYWAKQHGRVETPEGAMQPRDEPERAYAPLLGKVHAGTAQEPTVLDDRVPIPYEVWNGHKHGYFLRVEGTCMDNVYPEGCYVYIDPDLPPRNESIAVVSIDGSDYIMRRLYRGARTMVLSPDSHDPQWDDIVIKDDDHTVKMVGTVVWYQASEELS